MLNFDEQSNIELRSDEVQEILGTPPAWLVRWGSTVVLTGFALLVFVGWLVRYPDVIPAKIVLTTSSPPVQVVARTEGQIQHLMAEEGASVTEGQVIVVLQSTAKYDDIRRLQQSLARWLRLPQDSLSGVYPENNLELGDVQVDYAAFVQALESFRFGKSDKSRLTDNSISSINQQIQRLQQSIQYDVRAKSRLQNQLSTARDLYQNQESLFRDGIISRVKLEEERQKVSDLERLIDQSDESMTRKQSEIINLRSNINNVSVSDRADGATLGVNLRESLNKLRNSLDQWQQRYVMLAPVAGQLSLNSAFAGAQQFVRAGDEVFTIVPPSTNEIIGRLSLPIAGSGKVLAGQRVVVKLDGYPFHEFGTLEGTIGAKAPVPRDSVYNIVVHFKPKLVTSYGKTIPFEQQLQGRAEIVTEDKRFIERILDQVFALGH